MRKIKQEISGYIIERDDSGNINAISQSLGKKIELGQRVISNGRILPAGLGGIVIRIHQPYKNQRTSDIIEVLFDGIDAPIFMKFKDLL